MKRKYKKDLSIVNINDKDTCSDWPLIEKPVGSITYEHCLVERFYQDIYMGTAERNYYVDPYHELCICAHFNRRILGKYEFVPVYEFYITKKRMCLDIYWNLGNISDENMIIEKYIGLDAAKTSRYYEDFCDLKKKIEEGIEWKKTHTYDPFEYGSGSQFHYSEDNSVEYKVYEWKDLARREFVQFYFDISNDKWKKMSVSKESLSDLMRFFKDFEVLDREQLHIRQFMDINENAISEDGRYHSLYTDVDESRRREREIVYF